MNAIPQLIIRADAGGVLGTGHVMRMIALAQAYRRRGGEVTIASVQCPTPIVERVESLGIAHTFIQASELGNQQDANATLDLCHAHESQWLVLDGYHFDENYQKEVVGKGIKVLAVDDYGHCETWHADAVLNQNLGAENWSHRNASNPETRWLLGSSFALLREEFIDSILQAKEKQLPAKRVLITLGGSDPDNVTALVLQALEYVSLAPLELRVLVGGGNPHRAELEAMAESSKHQIELLTNVSDMPSMYEWTDAVISAGGSTCWEWLAYGLPGAVVTIADNQEPIVREFESRDLALCLGWFTEFDCSQWAEQLQDWLSGNKKIGSFETRRQIVDGFGAERAVASMTPEGLWCRRANLTDAKLYFDWANDPEVRKNGFCPDLILWENHIQWFTKKLQEKDSYLYIVSNCFDQKVGQVRLTPDPSGYLEIGFSVDVNHRGKGIGRKMLCLVLNQAIKSHHVKGYIARAKPSNPASYSIFEKLGFTRSEEASCEDCLVYVMDSKTFNLKCNK